MINFFKKILPLSAAKFQIYLLQLDEYDIGRYFLSFLKGRKLSYPHPFKKPLVWTIKLKLIIGLAFIIQFVFSFILARFFYLNFSYFWFLPALIVFLFLFFISFIFSFIFLSLAVLILKPFDSIVKKIIIAKAKKKISLLSNLTVIGITGSYGKTTTKEVAAAVLSCKFKALKTPDSVNTIVGIARLILKTLDPTYNVFIVEMGAYKKGEILAICKMVKPKISILTGIGESHLERFKNIANTIAAKFEIVQETAAGGLVILNAANDYIIQNYKNYTREDQRIVFYGNGTENGYRIESAGFDEKKLETIFKFSKGSSEAKVLLPPKAKKLISRFVIPVLGGYFKEAMAAAIIIGQELNMNDKELLNGLSQIKPAPHRLQPIVGDYDIFIIDDSYNGNFEGVKEAIRVLNFFKERRKIYITPGLAELGKAGPEIHKKIGGLLAPAADLVILIKNSVTPFLAEGLIKAGFPKENIIWLEEAFSVYNKINEVLKPGDVALFQNDWPENYF